MSKKAKTTVLTIEDILKRKEYFKKKKVETRELHIKSLDSNIVISKIDRDLYLEIADMDPEVADDHLVYNSIVEPNLKSQELQSQFELETPYDILYEIFEPGEVKSIAAQCLDFSGYTNNVSVVDEIKN